MKAVQGPALIIGNDAEFSQADWNNYTRKVGDSSKVNDPDTAGKFGKGALTAYSVSDVIQLVSGNQLLVRTTWYSFTRHPVVLGLRPCQQEQSALCRSFC